MWEYFAPNQAVFWRLKIAEKEVVLGWMVEELQLTASSVPTLGQLELKDQPIILGAKFRLPLTLLNLHQIPRT